MLSWQLFRVPARFRRCECSHVAGLGLNEAIPIRHLLRMINPIPVNDPSWMRRIGQEIQNLGYEEWNTGASASTPLRELGPLARGCLQEALKSATDEKSPADSKNSCRTLNERRPIRRH